MPADKNDLRAGLLAARAAMSPFAESQAIGDLAEWMYALPVELAEGDTVAAYVATRREPGGTPMLDALADRGLRVILPIVPEGPPQRLEWGVYRGERHLGEGRWNLLEPNGMRLDPDTLVDAKLILVPAVAADRRGVRLGRGAGYYDRTLAGMPGAIVAVVHDGELVEHDLPEDPTDVRAHWILTPSRGFVPATAG
ncbi:5-formyltetrahydrofolate cyclo-ligase [Gordonia sp. PP30]|uniref:5-formyltetrahydrofolate cyclo-ligase n=1 Tax=Gordonia sp. PP30 TaxID=2935861 RepID=UPI00200047F0|nr:5-formyltetrahydrofolate cyclo-ligase [Gordonia sp. PP30]UQE75871.1 5-formyltetrahydrofolate cyclo-ligase [Gordonia sp. PP30]